MKTLTLILLGVVALGCSGSGGSGTQAPVKTTVQMINRAYQPQSVTVAAGSVVEFTNPDTMAHTVTADVSGKGPDSSVKFPSGMAPNAVYDWTVPSSAVSGTAFYYHCLYHGGAGNGSALGMGMAGVVVVK